MLQFDVEKGEESYCWLDFVPPTNIENMDEIHAYYDETTNMVSSHTKSEIADKKYQNREDLDPDPDPEYVDNYYNDDLEKRPKMICERRTVIVIYSIIGLMFLFKIIMMPV